ncbi:hypothetical protein HHI36_009309 [Cryptolaemus montrouzieri]|uniref:IkappaB kinase n=1 Tax=Cryptolaemus montrouzieri TaxID=559131 RepID=A0ABD2MUY8_9CUCU
MMIMFHCLLIDEKVNICVGFSEIDVFLAKFKKMDHPREIGDWTNISVLGSGGFGTVLLWRSNTTNEYIAVKKCRIQCQSSLTSRQKSRWKHEVEKMKELCHPNIVKHKPLPPFLEEELNKFNPTKLPLLSLEYCDKGNLRHTLILPENLRGLKEESVRDLLLDISGAVSYLHQRNITHRDIKPENIVLHTWPERERGVIYKLIDLGYAKELGDATVSFVGTLLYLAPEIFSNQYYDCSVDYWSLGVLAFEVICGVLPFPAIMGTAERFRAIKNKGPEDICVYKSILGNLQYSTQLFKEIWISTCLKDHMEVWLRKALQFNPTLRSAPFPTTLNIFNQLNLILRKRILTVFSVYRYEFYSYEFDECTRLSTVRQWIARDTKIAENDQLLLGIIDFDNCDDQTLLIHCLCEYHWQILLTHRDASRKRV